MKSAEEDGEEDHERCRNLIVVGVEEFMSPGAGFPVGPPALAALACPSGPVVPLAAGRRAALARGLRGKLSMQWHTPPFDIPRTSMESSTWSLKLSLRISGRPKNSSSRKDLLV